MLFADLPRKTIPRRTAHLASNVVLIALPDEPPNQMLSAFPPPYGTVSVRGPEGPHRIAAMRCGPEEDRNSSADASVPSGDAASVTLVSDPLVLASELDAASRRRLLGFLLGFCRAAFGLAANTGFVGTCTRLARLCALDEGKAKRVARATPAWTVLSGVRAPRDAAFYVFGSTGVRLSAGPLVDGDLGLLLIETARGDELLLAMGNQPLLWTVPASPEDPPDILGAAFRGTVDPKVRGACLRALAAPTGGMAEAALREAQALAPARPRRHDDPASPIGATLEAALSDGEGGLFLRGWLRDPLALVKGLEIRTPISTRSVDPSLLHGVRRPDLARHFAKAAFRDGRPPHGFVAHVPDPSVGLCPQPVLTLLLGSGSAIEVGAPCRHLPPAQARDAVLSSIPADQATPSVMDYCLAPAAAALHRKALAARGSVDAVRVGSPIRNPMVSILIPVYRNLGFVRFQTAAFAADADFREAELIYVLDSPDQRRELESLLRGLHALHGLPFTMAVMPANLGYAAANNAGAAIARGRELLLLNSDVVPAGPGWLARMRAALASPGVGAAGPKLLFDDSSIQHAGLYFARDGEGLWYNAHCHKGMPRLWAAAMSRRQAPGVTGAALLVRRALFEAVGGVCEDYIIGDYEDSDFCLRLRGTGATIVYVPGAELYHFERRSIRMHPGYTGTLASLYNRRLHHRRWDGAMTELMARRAFRSLA